MISMMVAILVLPMLSVVAYWPTFAAWRRDMVEVGDYSGWAPVGEPEPGEVELSVRRVAIAAVYAEKKAKQRRRKARNASIAEAVAVRQAIRQIKRNARRLAA